MTSAFEHAIRRREESRSEVEGPSPLGQGYQKILQRLQGYRRERGRGAVCVLSSVPGEGVSSVARKTATALSNSGLERVVLIDASLQELGTLPANEPAPPYGLSDVVCGRVPLAAALTRRDDLGLTFLASGRRTAGYQQLFSSADLPAVLSELGRDYQWAIVDGPPIMTCPEVALLAHCVGAALLVIRAESTRWEVVKEAQKILENAGVEILGAVLNRRKYHVPDFIYRRI